MPSSFSHIVAGIGFGSLALPARVPRRYWLAAGAAAALPDVDYLWSYRGLPYEHWLSHRGLTHSLVFAAILACVITWTVLRPVVSRANISRFALALFLATATHGVFDGMSTYGPGVAFFLPSQQRYSLPWRPVSNAHEPGIGVPIRILQTFSRELLVIWLPSLLLWLAWRIRSKRGAMVAA